MIHGKLLCRIKSREYNMVHTRDYNMVHVTTIHSAAMIFFYIALLLLGSSCEGVQKDARLFEKLLDPLVYNKRVVPINNRTGKVEVKLAVIVEQINELNDRRQELHWAGYVRAIWNNPFLSWDPDKWNGQGHLFLREEDMWVPDITILERLDENIEFKEQPRRLLYVTYTGDVKWVLGGDLIVTRCPLNIYKFPFDEQTCSMQVGSYGIPDRYLDTIDPQQSNYSPVSSENAQWEVVGTESEIITRGYKNDFGDMDYKYILFKIHLRRKSAYYVLNILLPLLLMSLLMLGTFLIPSDGGEKMSFAITLLLAYNVIQLVITDNMPETSESLPIITVYVTTLLMMGAMLIPLSIATIYVHNHGCDWLPCCFRNYLAESLDDDDDENDKERAIGSRDVKATNRRKDTIPTTKMTKKATQPLVPDPRETNLAKPSCLTDGDKLLELLIDRLVESENRWRRVELDRHRELEAKNKWRAAADKLDLLFLKIVALLLTAITLICCILLLV